MVYNDKSQIYCVRGSFSARKLRRRRLTNLSKVKTEKYKGRCVLSRKLFVYLTLIVVLGLLAFGPKLIPVFAQGTSPSADWPQQGDRDASGKYFQIPLHGFTPNVKLNVVMNYSEKISESTDGSRRSDTWTAQTDPTDANGNVTWGGSYGVEGVYNPTISGPNGESLSMTLTTDATGALTGFSQSPSGSVPATAVPQQPPTIVPADNGGQQQEATLTPNGDGNNQVPQPTLVVTDPATGNQVIVTDVPVLIPTDQPPLIESSTNASQRIIIVGGEPFIREGEGTNFPAIGWTRAGNEFLYIETGSSGWYHIGFEGGRGWITNDGAFTVYRHIDIIVPTNTEPAPIIVPSDTPVIGMPEAQSGNGIHWGNFCSLKGYPPESHNQSDPFSLNCGNMKLNHDAVCLEVWGPSRPFAHHRDNELGSMTCEPSPQGAEAPVHPDAQTPDHGIATNKMCVDWGFDRANQSESGTDVALQHRCEASHEVMFLGSPYRTLYLGKREFNVACKDAYGTGYYAQLLNPDDLGSWKCVPNANAVVATPNGIDPRATTPTPAPPINPTPGPVIGPGDGYNPVGCPPALAAHLSVGSQGRSTDGGTPLKMRQAPGKSALQVGTLPNGGVFTVKAGPNCADAMNWWFIDYGGVLGWVEEGINGVYYVEPYSAPGQQPQPTVIQPTGDIVVVSLWDGTQISLSYEKSTNRILNGSQVVAWEINRLYNRINTSFPCGIQTADCIAAQMNQPFIDAFFYNAEIVGEVDAIRDAVQNKICNGNKSCESSLRYVVDQKLMDTSGPGNVVFGYVCADMHIPELWVEDKFSDFTQIISSRLREGKWQWSDYPDDKQQRRMGREIFAITGLSTVLPTTVDEASRNVGNINR